MTDMYYVIPDIHGRADLLERALHQIYNLEPNGCKIIFLGDYIDRGLENYKSIELVRHPKPGYEHVTLMGNHEDMFIEGYQRNNYYDMAAANEIYSKCKSNEFEDIIDWMRSLKLFHFEGSNVFAHAWYDGFASKETQKPEYVLWARMNDAETYHYSTEYYPTGLYLTHGHTPRKHGPIKTINRCNLDCGAVFYDRLVVGVYKYDKLGPQNFMEI